MNWVAHWFNTYWPLITVIVGLTLAVLILTSDRRQP